MKSSLDKLRDVVNIQNSPGNFDANEYMRGMANGLILALAIFEDKEPAYHGPRKVKKKKVKANG